jgi:hypothetical protein
MNSLRDKLADITGEHYHLLWLCEFLYGQIYVRQETQRLLADEQIIKNKKLNFRR